MKVKNKKKCEIEKLFCVQAIFRCPIQHVNLMNIALDNKVHCMPNKGSKLFWIKEYIHLHANVIFYCSKIPGTVMNTEFSTKVATTFLNQTKYSIHEKPSICMHIFIQIAIVSEIALHSW